jgi:hypothetical protein
MEQAGFFPFAASQSKSRDQERREYTKHMIRFRHSSTLQSLTVGEELAEVILINSHDGSSAYKLMAGIFRFVCSNGLIVSDSMQNQIIVRHSGNVIDAVVKGSTLIVDNAPKMLDAVRNWKNILLNDGEKMELAKAAHMVRFEGMTNAAIKPEQLLISRRREDTANDLWRVTNVIQENMIQGGLTGQALNALGRMRHTTTKRINGIGQDVKLNQALWTLSEELAKLKS